MFSISNIKSPGPDGFNSGFFKHTWGIVGELVCSAALEFFRTGYMPQFMSSTKLVILQKVQNPQTASDFRPISCCSVLYKCIAKMLCIRLKEVLPSIIDPSQAAFVKGRKLLHNVLICQDLARGYQRQHISPRCLLKIDIQKAFDSVHWGFLQEMLEGLKFPPLFIKWIMACVTSVSFQVHINGKDYASFKGGKGLKQGDPLSPLLFVITMEYLSRLLKRMSGETGFRFHPAYRKFNLTHLIFVDDLILFSKADPFSLQQIMSVLHKFQSCVGLKTNFHKSQMVFGGASLQLQQQCRGIVGLKESSFPLKYLGVPIVSSRLTKVECTELVDKMTARIHTWATRNISYAGRLVLINTVLFGIFNYWASIFLLPQEVIDRLTKVSRNFLWFGSEEFKHPPFLSWKQSCHTKATGGLGIKDYAAWNKATIARLVWDIARKKDNLWVKWIHGRYLRGKDWWDYSPPPDSSWYWKKLCKIKVVFKDGPLNPIPRKWD